MGADQPRDRDWTLLTMREDGFSFERLTGMTEVQIRWAARGRDPSVRAVFLYDPNGSYHDSWTRT